MKYSSINDKENLFVSKYQLYLPTEEKLKAEIERGIFECLRKKGQEMKKYTENDIVKILNNNSIELFEALRQIGNDVYLPIIKKIDEKDYFYLSYQALNNNKNAWEIGDILVNLAPYTKINIDNILKFYKLFYSKENGTSKHFRITESLISSNHTMAKILLEKLLKIDNNYVIPHISAILIELHKSKNENQYKIIIDFLKGDNLFQLKCAIGYIHLFNFSDEELNKIFELFEEKVKLENSEIDKALLYSSFDLIEKDYDNFSEILLLYIKNYDINIKSDLSQILMYACKNHINKEWFIKLFNSIIDFDTDKQHIIYNIESVLTEFLKNDDYKFVKDFLYKWIEKGNLSSISSKNTLTTFKDKFNKHKLFSKFVTESLVYENNKLHKVIADLVENGITLDISVMQTFNIDDYLYVCRKILGYFYEFETMNTMIFSILSVDNLSNEAKYLVIDILINYIGKNYSHDTLEFFKGLNDIELKGNEKEAKNKIIEVLEERNKQIKELSILKELTPSSEQNRIISRIQSIAMVKAMKESEKDSFWSQIATKIPICCGRGWFSEFRGTFTEVSYMQSHSHSITIPTFYQKLYYSIYA